MNGLVINVDWPYFLGIIGTLIGIAYYANGRFTKIETTVEWLKQTLLEIKEKLDNRTMQWSVDEDAARRLGERPKRRRRFE